MQRLTIFEVHKEPQILNHRGGSLVGVAGVYIRHQLKKEKREALERWADYVEGVCSWIWTKELLEAAELLGFDPENPKHR